MNATGMLFRKLESKKPAPGVRMVGSGQKIRAPVSPRVSFCAGRVRFNLLPTI